jgi:hypothetical protein
VPSMVSLRTSDRSICQRKSPGSLLIDMDKDIDITDRQVEIAIMAATI